MRRKSPVMLTAIWLLFTSLLAFLLVLFLLASCAPNGLEETPALENDAPASFTPTPYTFTGQTIRLAWFYRPPKSGTLSQIAEHFDFIILTKQDTEERDTLYNLGVSKPIPQYFRMDAIMDPGGCDKRPWRNQVAYEVGDFCWISQEHPDWFLLDRAGNRITSDGEFYYMDPGHPGWREFFLQRARKSQEEDGWFGVFLDNAEASFGKREKRNLLPGKYPDEASYVEAIEGFLSYLSTNYFRPARRPLYANIISLRDEAVWYRYLNYLDGAMEEGWAVDWDNDYYSPNTWDAHLTRAEKTQFYGREAILVSQGERNDYDRQLFAFASYLLINHGKASFRYASYSAYLEIWLYDDYFIDLGVPLGPRYPDGDVWRRDFTRGTVEVDPFSGTAQIIIP